MPASTLAQRSSTRAAAVAELLRSFRWALSGLRDTLARGRNFRIQLAAGAVALLATLWLQAPLAPIVLAIALVLSLELVNTAIEATVDLATATAHPLAKRAKDAAAGAVLLASALSIAVAAATLGPPLWGLLFGGRP